MTGDYQGVTDPDALERLLDIQAQYEGRVDLRVYLTTDPRDIYINSLARS